MPHVVGGCAREICNFIQFRCNSCGGKGRPTLTGHARRPLDEMDPQPDFGRVKATTEILEIGKTLKMTGPWRVDVLQCRGSSYDAGKQLAEGFLKTTRGATFHRRKGHLPLGFDLKDAQAALCTYAPNIWEELHGLADGLKIPFERAVAQYSNARLDFQKRGCSSVMTNVSYGRNYDYSPRRYDPTLVAIQSKGVHASLAFADRFTGRVDGMNEHGLCVGLHLVNYRPVRPGLACILIVRMVLDQCATTQEAVRLLKRIPHGQPFNYSLLDAGGFAAVVEASPLATAVREGRQLACTNHFQIAALERYNRQYPGSHRRLPPLEKWLRAELSCQQLFVALNHAESPVFDHGYRSGSGTLHTFVCEPAERTMLVGIGGDASPRSIDFDKWTRGASLGFSQLEGQLGTRDRPFDPRIRIPTKKTVARRASVAADT
jgi:predicted choloylglycine hydrolase